MSDYKAGDQVWGYWCDNRSKSVTCPVCFGKLVVVLILGDDTHVELPCDYCGKGYGRPQGHVTITEYSKGARIVTLDRVETTETQNGVTHRYITVDNRCYEDDGVFDTEDEAMAKADEVAIELNTRRDTQTEFIKANTHKTFAWNAGYHMREAKSLQKRMDRHKKLAKICKARVKGVS